MRRNLTSNKPKEDVETKEDKMQNIFLANACSLNDVLLQTLLVNSLTDE